jgi:hypothetical protein
MKEKLNKIRLIAAITVAVAGIALIIFRVVPALNKTASASDQAKNTQNTAVQAAGAKKTVELPEEEQIQPDGGIFRTAPVGGSNDSPFQA